MTGEDDRRRADRAPGMSREMAVKAATLARIVGTGFVIVGAATACTWLWLTARIQYSLDDHDPGLLGGARFRPVSFVDQVSVQASIMQNLLYAALAIGIGFGLRLAADYAVVRAGGSLTGLEPGDPAPAELPPPDRRQAAPSGPD